MARRFRSSISLVTTSTGCVPVAVPPAGVSSPSVLATKSRELKRMHELGTQASAAHTARRLETPPQGLSSSLAWPNAKHS